MRAVVQRVRSASVEIAGETVAHIGPGALVLLGVAEGDTDADARYLAGKVARLRVFDDADGRMNASIREVGGSFLVVSQFTLYGDCRKGNRPSYIRAAEPEAARRLYGRFAEALRAEGHGVEEGRFREQMLVSLENDGPVTLILESKASRAAQP